MKFNVQLRNMLVEVAERRRVKPSRPRRRENLPKIASRRLQPKLLGFGATSQHPTLVAMVPVSQRLQLHARHGAAAVYTAGAIR